MKKRTELISKKRINREEAPYLKELDIMAVDLYRIEEGTVIPREALDPEVWDIPEG